MAKKLKTYDVLVAWDISVYAHIDIKASSSEDAEKRLNDHLKKHGEFPDATNIDVAWDSQSNYRVLDGCAEEREEGTQ